MVDCISSLFVLYVDERGVKELDIGGKAGRRLCNSKKVLEGSLEARVISNLRKDEMNCETEIKQLRIHIAYVF